MANSQTVVSLAGIIRTRADQIGSPTFSDTVELNGWIRDSLKTVYNHIVDAWRDWYTVTRPLSLIQGVERYTLPSDFRALQAMYLIYNSGNYREQMYSFQRSDLGRYGYDNMWRTWPIMYRLESNKVYFAPQPASDYQNVIEIFYTPQWRGPVLDWSPIDQNLPNGWEEWVVLDVLYKMMTKMSKDASDVVRQRDEALKAIIAGRPNRDSDPPQMRDIYQYPKWTWYNGAPGGLITWAGY